MGDAKQARIFSEIFFRPVILWYLVIYTCNPSACLLPEIEYFNLDKESRVTITLTP